MAHLFGNTSGDLLTTDDGVTLLTDDLPTGPVFPPTLLLRLRLHAILFWGTILLMQTIP